jgi:hypothetical protein
MADINDILADVKVEGKDTFDNLTQEKDTLTESLPAKEPEAVKPEEGESTPEKDIPFHKHPRWIEREREAEELRAKVEEDQRIIAELKSFKEEIAQKLPHDSVVPDWFQELYGNNQVAWQKYSEYDKQQREQIKRDIIAEQEQARSQIAEESNRWNKWVDTEIDKLSSDGAKFDKNKLIKVMLDYRPTDENNNFDFKAGLKIYQALEGNDNSASQARKELADTTTRSSSRGEPKKKDYMTPADLRNRSWMSL